MRLITTLLLFVSLITSCSQPTTAEKPPATPVDGHAIREHIQRLASDEMEGRAPGGKGEELATSYIADFYRSIGLRTQFQAVPMIGITSTVSPMKLTGKAGYQKLKFGIKVMTYWIIEKKHV